MRKVGEWVGRLPRRPFSLFEPKPFTASVSAPILSAFVAQVFSSPATLSRYLAPSKAPWISMPSIDETLQYECSAPREREGRAAGVLDGEVRRQPVAFQRDRVRRDERLVPHPLAARADADGGERERGRGAWAGCGADTRWRRRCSARRGSGGAAHL